MRNTFGYLVFLVWWVGVIYSLSSHFLATAGVPAISLLFASLFLPVPLPWILRYYAQRQREMSNQDAERLSGICRNRQ